MENPQPPQATWQDFCELGDQFLVAYSRLDGSTVPVTLFTVGHSVELYLKAALLKIDPQDNPTQHGHRVDRMLKKFNEVTDGFMAEYTLRQRVYDKKFTGPIPMSQTGDPDYIHYIQNQELYWIAKYLMDLKYLGTIHKALPYSFSVMVCACNPYWVVFLSKLRSYLGWPQKDCYSDCITRSLESDCHPLQRQFLQGLALSA